MRRAAAAEVHWPGIQAAVERRIRDGGWFAIPSGLSYAEAQAFRCGEEHALMVGECDGEIVCTCYTCPIRLAGGP